MRNTNVEMRTSNVEHRTSNFEVKRNLNVLLRRSKLDVRRSTFAFLLLGSSLVGCGGGNTQTMTMPSNPLQPTPPPPPPAQLVAANQALNNHQPEAAIGETQAFLHDHPTGPLAAQALYLQGRGYEEKLAAGPDDMNRNLSDAHASYLLALQQSPSATLEGDIRTSLANVEFFQDQFSDCIQQATTAISLISSDQMKSYLLYRIGVSQQRLEEFSLADQTFRQVIQRYPNTPIAEASKDHLGQTKFYVQVATYSGQDIADRAAEALRKSGIIVSQRTDSKGHVIIDDGPFATYREAKTARDGMIREFPDALVVP